MEMAKMLGTMMTPVAEEKKEEKNEIIQYRPIPFDEELQTSDMKMIKSILPYMNSSQQKLIGVIIKIMEIKNLIEKKDEDIVVMQTENEEELSKEILKTVQPYCQDDRKNMVNILLRMMELKKILLQVETLREVL